MTPSGSLEELALPLARAERRLRRRLEVALKAHGRSVEEWRVLSCLVERTGRSMADIADFALLPAPSLTRLVDRLVADTLVYRRIDEQDRRRVLVFLSAHGLAEYRRLSDAVSSSPAPTWSAQDVAELAQLAYGINQLTAGLGSVTADRAGSRRAGRTRRSSPSPTGCPPG